MPEAISDGIRITCDDVGQGEPALLMMPGWCANRSAFQELMPLCSRSRRTLTLDWRGQRFEVKAPLVGRHNRDNLLAACACALLWQRRSGWPEK